jgi:peroxiredoxin
MRRLHLAVMTPFLLLALTCAAPVGASGTRQEEAQGTGIRVGQAAPDFTLVDADGKTYTLSSLRGKVVLINFWATWCPPCLAEMPSMEQLNSRFAGEDFVLLAINAEEDARDIVLEFLEENPHSFPVLLDGELKVQQQYGVYRFPESFIVRRDGIIAQRVSGAIGWNYRKIVNLISFLIKG